MSAITESAIIEAAEALQEEGVNPTQVTVRERLGGGSFATIGPVLKRWKQRKQEVAVVPQVDLPSDVSDALREFGAAIWQRALAVAESRMEHERERIEQERQDAALEQQEASDYITRLERENEELKVRLKSSEDERIRTRQWNADITNSNERLKGENSVLNDRIADLKSALGMLGDRGSREVQQELPVSDPAMAQDLEEDRRFKSFLQVRPQWMDGLSDRIAQALYNELQDSGFDQLCEMFDQGYDFSKIPNIGKKTAADLEQWIEDKRKGLRDAD